MLDGKRNCESSDATDTDTSSAYRCISYRTRQKFVDGLEGRLQDFRRGETGNGEG